MTYPYNGRTKKKCKGIRCGVLTLFLLAIFTVTLSATAFAAENEKYIYVASTGSDQNKGETPETAVRSLNKAMLSAVASEADRAVIVITDAYDMPKTYTEITHKIPFVYTTNDGKTDYGAAGAKLCFAKGLRFVLNGDTTFENIAIEYSGSLNFVAQYNPITFGKGVTHTRPEGGSGVYIVGGWQSPGEGRAANLDSHITIESGTFRYVIGGSRQSAGGAELTFTGTHHITVNGGEIETLYAGSLKNHSSRSAKLEIGGGRVRSLYLGGDAERVMRGDVSITCSGGEIEALHVQDVVGNATVSLTGAKVAEIDFAYSTDAIRQARRAAKATDKLIYSGYFYTAEEIAGYTGFAEVQNNTVIYTKQGASGKGFSESDPAAFADAMRIAAKNGGAVHIIGKIRLDNFAEPFHSQRITLLSASTDAEIVITGKYTLAGETCFDKLTLSGNGTLDATGGMLVTTEHIRLSDANLLLRGSAILGGGRFAEIRDAKAVSVCGAEVERVTGGSDETYVTVYSGRIGTLAGTDTSVRVFALTMYGGSIEKVIFKNVTESLSYRTFGGSVSQYVAEGKNVQGALYIERADFLHADLGPAKELFAEQKEAVFFLRDGATGSGKSAYDASASLTAAYAALKKDGGTLVICGPYTLRSSFTAASHAKPVVITSVYDGVDYAKHAHAELVFEANFTCGGGTVFREITLTAAADYKTIFANCYPLVLDTGITSCLRNTDTYLSVMGGGSSAIHGSSTNLTIRSGKWQRVRGGAAADGSMDATVSIEIDGGEFYEYVTLGGSASHSGDIRAVIGGGTFYQGIFASSLSKTEHSFGSKVSLAIDGGIFYGYIAPARKTAAQYLGSYSGCFDVVINGGNFDHLTELFGTDEKIGSMTSSLRVSDSIDLDAPVKGTMTFTNPVKVKSDPWLFYHDGYYYLTGSAAYGITVVKVPNIGDLQYADYEKVYSSPIKSNWSAEIHHFTDAEVGEGNGGWYCYIGSPEDGVENATRRMYVIKCLDGDNLMGRWGNPVTGEVNVPQRVLAPDIEDYKNWWGAGQSVIRIGGKVYALFVSEVGRNTAEFHQTINIMQMENPWTLKGQASVICKPEYDWEKVGYSYNPNSTGKNKAYPAVVEGATALYGKDGSIFLTYTGSGVWTTEYQIGYMQYLGGDPMDPASWKKNPTSILYKSDEICGTGHGSFVTDTAGQTWVCYHAYKGRTTDGDRYAVAEPVYADKNGVLIGTGTGIAAPLDTVYEVALNPMPFGKKISGFDTMSRIAYAGVTLKMTLGKTDYTVNGEKKAMDVAPIIANSRTMLPVRYVAEALGAKVEWDGATATATLKTADTEIRITVGAAEAVVNGQTVSLDSPAFIRDNRTYMPVRFVAETLGAVVEWDGATSTATITK